MNIHDVHFGIARQNTLNYSAWTLGLHAGARHRPLLRALAGLLIGLSYLQLISCSTPITQRPARIHRVTLDYSPERVRNPRHPLPPVRLIVLRPVDNRQRLAIHPTRGQALPSIAGEGTLIGFHGLNSQEGSVTIGPQDETPDLGVRRRMDAGMQHPPDIPKIFFTFDQLSTTVQAVLAAHFRTAGVQVLTAPATHPDQQIQEEQQAHYALGCTIEEFSLLSLRRYQQFRVFDPFGSRLMSIPVRGPTRATVSLSLTLYHLPSQEVVWQENVWDIVHDPPRDESRHRYGTVEETLSAALSRAVESLFAAPSLQAALSAPVI